MATKKVNETDKKDVLNPVTTEGAKVPVTASEMKEEKEHDDNEELLKAREEANQKGLPDPEDHSARIVRPAQESAAPVTQPSQIVDGIKVVTDEPVIRHIGDPRYVPDQVITDKTREEMDAGRKAVATAKANAAKPRDE